jgi:hypothetical protein
LKFCFFQEAQFLVVEGWPSSVEDEVISLFPNLSGRYHKYFHEVRRAMSLPSSLKGCEEIRLVAPMNVEVTPGTFTELAVKEKVEGYFFPFVITENTCAVIALDFEMRTSSSTTCRLYFSLGQNCWFVLSSQ